MADNKKYYYLKLKEDFFDADEIKVLEALPDGFMYSNLLLKLYLTSLKTDGKLMLNKLIPYNSAMLSAITRLPVGVVEKGISILQEMNLIEVLDNGTIYMTDIQNYIGKSSTEGDRKREYRRQIESERALLEGSSSENEAENGHLSDKRPPENIDKSLENRDKSLDNDTTQASSTEETVVVETVETARCSKDDLTKIAEAWNSLGLNQLRKISMDTIRGQMLKARIREYGYDNVLSAIFSIKDCPFLLGQSNSGWTITFDWFVKPNNFIKVLEGNYRPKSPKQVLPERETSSGDTCNLFARYVERHNEQN